MIKPVRKFRGKGKHNLPPRKKGPVGRPQFAVTAKMRKRVSDMVGCDMSHENIARAIGCTPLTLKLHFSEELQTGRATLREEALAMIIESAREGNVSARRKLVSMTVGSDLADVNMKFSSDRQDDPKPPKKGKLGKKELQQQDAESMEGGNKYRAPDPPDMTTKRVVN